MPIHHIQPTFAGGELAPSLRSRVDLQRYPSGLAKARNCFIHPHGGCSNRPGLRYIAATKTSASRSRLIDFVFSTAQAYVIEFGAGYCRFFKDGAQVLKSSPSAWVTTTGYVVGDFVAESGTTYYCIVAHTSGTFATDLAAGKWRAQTAYEIPTDYTEADVTGLDIKVAQSADVLYIVHPAHAPKTLTRTAHDNWTLDDYAYTGGPFMLGNKDSSLTITPSGLSGSIGLSASSALFDPDHVGALFQMIHTVNGQTTTPAISASVKNWIATGTTWQIDITGTWSGTILLQKSLDNLNWTTVGSYTTNQTATTGTTGFALGYLRAIVNSSLSFSGSASVTLTGNASGAGPTAVGSLNAVTGNIACGPNATITITGVWNATVSLDKSIDGGLTWAALATYTTNQAGTVQATAQTECLVRAKTTVYTSGTPTVTISGDAPTLAIAVSTASQSQAIQCGQTWRAITSGTWTGKLRVEVSVDQGANWSLVRSLQGGANYDVTGDTEASQCLLRVSSDPTVAFTGSVTVDLTSSSFDWYSIVEITAYSSSTSVTATVQALSNTNDSGVAAASATWQWAEGSWSDYRGWPSCVAFYQDRLWFAATDSEPQTAWATETSDYESFARNSPLLDSDGITVSLPSQKVNIIRNLVPIGKLLALTSAADWIITSSTGAMSPTTVQTKPQGFRGSAVIAPVLVGNRVISIQPMGKVVRDIGFSLESDGYTGNNISIMSNHLFQGYDIVGMAYAQEPDSLVWAVRSDGALLSLTYLPEQEVLAWTRHDTEGEVESICSIPGDGYDEVWVIVKRVVNGEVARYVERLDPRMASTDPADQFYVDSGLTLDAPITITGITAAANSVTVEATAHGLSNGNLVDLRDIVWAKNSDGVRPDDLNQNRYKVANKTANAFEIKTVAGAAVSGSDLEDYESGGTIRVVVSSVGNLGHLEGEEVAILANGMVQPRQTVSGASIPLSVGASIVHVGLPYTMEMETLAIEIPQRDGTMQGRKVKISDVRVRFLDSAGGKIGPTDEYEMDQLIERGVDAQPFGHPIPLYTGEKVAAFQGGWEDSGKMLIQQTDPLPLTILALIPRVQPGG